MIKNNIQNILNKLFYKNYNILNETQRKICIKNIFYIVGDISCKKKLQKHIKYIIYENS